MTTLETLEAQLRSAAESRLFADVERLVVEYCAAARSYLTSLASGSAEMRHVERQIQSTLKWTSHMLRAGRESIALELNRLPRVKNYLEAPPAVRSSWHMEG